MVVARRSRSAAPRPRVASARQTETPRFPPQATLYGPQHFAELAEATSTHVTRDKWWGVILHVGADDFRLPYTAGGFRYDLNHAWWRGPNTGEGCSACR